MSKVVELRRANVRQLLGERGSLTELSKRMGYRNPSFLSQMLGPEPTREITEKTARKIEKALGLGQGSLDQPIGYQRPSQAPSRPDPQIVALVADVIRMVGQECDAAEVHPSPGKLADIAALVLAASFEQGAPPADHIKKIVRLLK